MAALLTAVMAVMAVIILPATGVILRAGMAAILTVEMSVILPHWGQDIDDRDRNNVNDSDYDAELLYPFVKTEAEEAESQFEKTQGQPLLF